MGKRIRAKKERNDSLILKLAIIIGICYLVLFFPWDEWLKPDPEYPTLIEVNKLYCHGQCPVYKITIFANGTAFFEGKEDVPIIGNRTEVRSPEELDELFRKLENINFFGLDSVYRGDYYPTYTILAQYKTKIQNLTVQGNSSVVHEQAISMIEDFFQARRFISCECPFFDTPSCEQQLTLVNLTFKLDGCKLSCKRPSCQSCDCPIQDIPICKPGRKLIKRERILPEGCDRFCTSYHCERAD